MSIYVTLPQEKTTKLSPDHHRHCCEERGLNPIRNKLSL